MSIASIGEPEPIPYVGAYRIAKKTWLYMLTDDEACRSICDREAYLHTEIANTYPDIPEADRRWIGEFALSGIIADFHR